MTLFEFTTLTAELDAIHKVFGLPGDSWEYGADGLPKPECSILLIARINASYRGERPRHEFVFNLDAPGVFRVRSASHGDQESDGLTVSETFARLATAHAEGVCRSCRTYRGHERDCPAWLAEIDADPQLRAEMALASEGLL